MASQMVLLQINLKKIIFSDSSICTAAFIMKRIAGEE
jgi:hypothetical protein